MWEEGSRATKRKAGGMVAAYNICLPPIWSLVDNSGPQEKSRLSLCKPSEAMGQGLGF